MRESGSGSGGTTGSGYARDQSTTLFEHEEPIAIDVSLRPARQAANARKCEAQGPRPT